MMTVNEVSKLAGVSIRTLQYYDKIGLLHPTGYTDAGYRLYDDADLERLQHILLFRELEFPLKDIKMIVNSPDFDRSKALEQQIELLKLKKEHIENLMNFALGIKLLGVKHMDFKAFDRSATLPLISGMDLRKKAGKISIHRRNCSVADMLRILWRVSS